MSRRRLSKGELALWQHAMRDTSPLAGRETVVPPAVIEPIVEQTPPKPASKLVPAIAQPAPPRREPIALRTGAPAPGLDRGTQDRFSAGRLPIEGRLDLHGMTQDQARASLDSFIERAWVSGRRVLLVITGKGVEGRGQIDSWARDGRNQSLAQRDLWDRPGVLRANVPRWLGEAPNRTRVLAFSAAQPKDGGGGALYVLLRRQRA